MPSALLVMDVQRGIVERYEDPAYLPPSSEVRYLRRAPAHPSYRTSGDLPARHRPVPESGISRRIWAAGGSTLPRAGLGNYRCLEL
jgi:hypothetical protein